MSESMDRNVLYQQLMNIWKKSCTSVRGMAQAIGLSPITLQRFIDGKEPIQIRSLMKIKRYIEKEDT